MQAFEYRILSQSVQRTDRSNQIGIHGQNLLHSLRTGNFVGHVGLMCVVVWTLTRERDDGVYVDGLDRLSVRRNDSQDVSLHTELGWTNCAKRIDEPESIPLAGGHCEHFQRSVGHKASVGVL